jgi:hypothetical protein
MNVSIRLTVSFDTLIYDFKILLIIRLLLIKNTNSIDRMALVEILNNQHL